MRPARCETVLIANTCCAAPFLSLQEDYVVPKNKKRRKGEKYVDVDSGMVKVAGGKKRTRRDEADDISADVDDATDATDATVDTDAAVKGQAASLDSKEEEEVEVEVEEEEEEKDDDDNDDEESRTMFVSNLPSDVNRKQLLSLFKGAEQPIESLRIRGAASTSEDGVKLPEKFKGNDKLEKKVMSHTSTGDGRVAYVVFKNAESVSEVTCREWKLKDCLLFCASLSEDPSSRSAESVFIGNLPYGATEETLRRHVEERLSDGGRCLRIRLVRDRDSRKCTGVGYALLSSKQDVSDILKSGLGTYMKRELRVEVCGKRTKTKGGKNRRESKKGKRGRENAQDGVGRRVLGKMKRKGEVSQPAPICSCEILARLTL